MRTAFELLVDFGAGDPPLTQIPLRARGGDNLESKVGYEAPASSVTIDADAAVEVAVAVVPEENPDAAWQM